MNLGVESPHQWGMGVMCGGGIDGLLAEEVRKFGGETSEVAASKFCKFLLQSSAN